MITADTQYSEKTYADLVDFGIKHQIIERSDLEKASSEDQKKAFFQILKTAFLKNQILINQFLDEQNRLFRSFKLTVKRLQTGLAESIERQRSDSKENSMIDNLNRII